MDSVGAPEDRHSHKMCKQSHTHIKQTVRYEVLTVVLLGIQLC
jgi:hypothetical protein